MLMFSLFFIFVVISSVCLLCEMVCSCYLVEETFGFLHAGIEGYPSSGGGLPQRSSKLVRAGCSRLG